MLPEDKRQVAAQQRRRFNELVDAFDTPQPHEVMGRLEQIVAAARLPPRRGSARCGNWGRRFDPTDAGPVGIQFSSVS
jgi:hypothetical protein